MKNPTTVLAITLFAATVGGVGLAAEPPPSPAHAPSIDEKARKLLDSWKPRLDEEDFNAVVAGPFVIAGNGSAQQIARYRDSTILAAAKALHAQFFRAEPTEPILILLFETEGPYRRLAKKWFDDGNVPHYGFYRHRDHVMLMNVGTGTGTLVHELTHALIAPDFPTVPDWFNEGLASLYEQCTIDADTIRGLPNWRLPALQKAIEGKSLRPLSDLIADRDFRNEQRVGINYAQARYLMFYLQEKGLLKRYYVEFRDHADKDPTGIESLKKVIGPASVEELDVEWRKWVLTLSPELAKSFALIYNGMNRPLGVGWDLEAKSIQEEARMLFDGIDGLALADVEQAMTRMLAQRDRAPAASPVGGAAKWSMAELRLDEKDFAWLKRWSLSLHSEPVYRALTNYGLPLIAGKETLDPRVGIGAMLLLLFSEVARREASDGKLWPVIYKAGVFTASTRLALFTSQHQPKARVFRAIKAAAIRLGLRHGFNDQDVPDEDTRWEGYRDADELDGDDSTDADDGEAEGGPRDRANKQLYLTVLLQFGFSRPGYEGNLRRWLAGVPAWDAVEALRGVNGVTDARGRDLASPSFQRMWEVLRRVARGDIADNEAIKRLKQSPWVLPEWVPSLFQAAAAQGAALAPDEVSREFLTAPQWRWSLPNAPAVFCNVQNLAHLGLDERNSYDLWLGTRRCGRLVFDGERFTLIAAPGSSADAAQLEVELPRPLQPAYEARLVSREGETAATQPVAVWDPGAAVSIRRNVTSQPNEIDVDEALKPALAYDLIVSGGLSIEPVPADSAVLAGGRFTLYRLAPPWNGALTVKRADNTVVWRPNIGAPAVAGPEAVRAGRISAARRGVTVTVQAPPPRRREGADQPFDVAIDHERGFNVTYLWCQGQEGQGLAANASGTRTTCRVALPALADPRWLDLYIGLTWEGEPLRPVHRRERVPVTGIFRETPAGYQWVGPAGTVFVEEIDQGKCRFVTQGVAPDAAAPGGRRGQDDAADTRTWYAIEGGQVVGPVRRAERRGEGYAGLGGELQLQHGLFHPATANQRVAQGVLGGGILSPRHPPEVIGGEAIAASASSEAGGADAPVSAAPLPDAPLPDAPLPLPDAPLPDALLPDAPLPDALPPVAPLQDAAAPQSPLLPALPGSAPPQGATVADCSPPAGTAGARLRVRYAVQYAEPSSEQRLVAWTRDGRFICLGAPRGWRDGDVNACEADLPADLTSTGSICAAGVWFKQRRLGTTWNDEWAESVLAAAPADPGRLARLLRWLRLPVLQPQARELVDDLARSDPAGVLAAWTGDLTFTTDDNALTCFEEISDESTWLGVARAVFGKWAPPDADTAVSVVKAVTPDVADERERVGAAVEALLRVDCFLAVNTLDAFMRSATAAPRREEVLRSVRRRLLLAEHDNGIDAAVERMVFVCSVMAASTLRQGRNPTAPDPNFIRGVCEAAARVRAGTERSFDRHTVEMLSQFSLGRRLLTQHLVMQLSQK